MLYCWRISQFTVKALGLYFTINFCTCTRDQSTRWSKITALNSCSVHLFTWIWDQSWHHVLPRESAYPKSLIWSAVNLYLDLGPELAHVLPSGLTDQVTALIRCSLPYLDPGSELTQCAPLRISWSKITDLKQLFICTWIWDQSWHNVLPSGSADQTTAWKNRSFQPYYVPHFCFLEVHFKTFMVTVKGKLSCEKKYFWNLTQDNLIQVYQRDGGLLWSQGRCLYTCTATVLTWYFVGI